MLEVTFLDGTGRFPGIEDGLWTIRGDNGVTYDLSGLAKDFQQVGLRVHLVTRERKERGIDRERFVSQPLQLGTQFLL